MGHLGNHGILYSEAARFQEGPILWKPVAWALHIY